MKLTPSEVAVYAHNEKLRLFELENLESIPKNIPRPDFIVVAGYGQKIPEAWLSFPTTAAINMHPSLLPEYRGAFPAEWAILRGEKTTGVTLLIMSSQFDKGDIVAQKKLPIEPTDTKITLYKKDLIVPICRNSKDTYKTKNKIFRFLVHMHIITYL